MIGFLKGKVFSVEGSSLLLEVNGVGYEVFMAQMDLHSLVPGKEAFIHIHYHQKEDLTVLFGFLQKKSKEVFQTLTSVSGFGPKTALGILSHISEEELIMAIRDGDLGALVRIPGIGNKTAQRLIFELQDKLAAFGAASQSNPATNTERGSLYSDAEAALMFLGYNKKEIEDVLRKVMKSKEQPELNDLIRDALKELGK